MTDYLVEVLLDADHTSTLSNAPSEDITVYVGTTYSEGTVSDVSVVEVYAVTPDADTKVEAYQFTHQAPLQVMTGSSQLPIEGGTFSIASIAARVATAPTGSSVVLDVKKNGTTIFGQSADRPTIIDGGNVATVGSWGNVTLTTGDYLTVDVVQVGSTTPGANLVMNLRLRKIG